MKNLFKDKIINYLKDNSSLLKNTTIFDSMLMERLNFE